MSAASFLEQRDITGILETAIPTIAVLATFRGDTVTQVDAAMQGLGVNGKLAGGCILVQQPGEEPESDRMSVLIPIRTHRILVLELAALNRKADGTFICGYTCDDLKDLVLQCLHAQWLGAACLQWHRVKPYEDDAGCFGYEIEFRIEGQLGQLGRSADPDISIATVAAVAAVVTFAFTGYDASGVTLSVDGSPQVIAPGGNANEIPAGLATPSGWTRADVDAVVTFTRNTPGGGHTATKDNASVGLTLNAGANAQDQVTLTGANATGEVLRYTTDGTTPVPGGATVHTYSAPFAAPATGTLIRAASTATGKAFSGITQLRVP